MEDQPPDRTESELRLTRIGLFGPMIYAHSPFQASGPVSAGTMLEHGYVTYLDNDSFIHRYPMDEGVFMPIFLAKTYKDSSGVSHPSFTVFQHSVLVGASALALFRHHPEYLESNDAQGWRMAYLFSCHDVGKVSPGFQEMLKCALMGLPFPSSSYYCRHHEEGTICLPSEFKAVHRDILRLHHGGIRCGCPDHPSKFGTATGPDGIDWELGRSELLSSLGSVFGADGLPSKGHLKGYTNELKAQLCIADWVGSDEGVFPPDPSDPGYPFRAGWDLAGLVDRAEEALLSYGLGSEPVAGGRGFSDVFPFPASSMQELLYGEVERRGPGVYLLEAPMGSGKTEASLYASYLLMSSGRSRGLYFALPTQVTSNKIHERLVSALLGMGLVSSGSLIHARSSVVYQRRSISRADTWFRNNKRAILSQFGVGTLDQALLGVLEQVKHWFLRVLGVRGKVLILDEIHSYDTYTGVLLQQLIKSSYGAGDTVILLSATLTAGAKAKLLGVPVSQVSDTRYPLVTSLVSGSVSQEGLPSRLHDRTYKVSFGDRSALLSEAISRASSGMKVLWFENTVAEAQEAYRVAASLGPASGLLHSRYTVRDRGQKEDIWIGRFGKGSPSGGYLLFATQVAEQSLDIDADCMYTSLCPMDMLLQRSGRVWRHDRSRPLVCPEIKIHHGDPENVADFAQRSGTFQLHAAAKAYGKSLYVYEPYLLAKTFKVLSSWGGDLHIPSDIRGLLEETYKDDGSWSVLRSEMERSARRLESLGAGAAAGTYSAPGSIPDPDDRPPSTRYIETDDTEVLLASDLRSIAGRHQAVLDGAWVWVDDRRQLPLMEDFKIRVRYSKVEGQVRKVKVGKYDQLVLVSDADGWILDSGTGRRSGHRYTTDFGLVYGG